MITAVHVAALLTAAAGLVVANVALVMTRRISLSLAVLLDFFTAASLLRLVGPLTWALLGTAALTIVIRQFASRGLLAAEDSDPLSIILGRSRASTIGEAFRRRRAAHQRPRPQKPH
jgi:hypothetical protein